MPTAQLLALILPYLPALLEFLAARLDRTIPELIVLLDKQLNRPLPQSLPKSDDAYILETVRGMVSVIDTAHPTWSDTDKHTAAVGAIRTHLGKSGLNLTDSQVNLLIEVYVTERRPLTAVSA